MWLYGCRREGGVGEEEGKGGGLERTRGLSLVSSGGGLFIRLGVVGILEASSHYEELLLIARGGVIGARQERSSVCILHLHTADIHIHEGAAFFLTVST